MLLKEWKPKNAQTRERGRQDAVGLAAKERLQDAEEDDEEVGNETMDFIPYAPILRKVSAVEDLSSAVSEASFGEYYLRQIHCYLGVFCIG